MNIVIIEDELKTAKSLEKILLELKPGSNITGPYQGIEESVKVLSAGTQPDLIFMDIQLADGLCFEIFKSVQITSPVIFCTAFDEYMLEAFRSNGVDYLLKPVTKDHVKDALKKVEDLKNFFQRKNATDFESLLSRIAPQTGKSSFLIFKNQKYITVQTSDIAFFHIKNDTTYITCFDKREFVINQPLDQIVSSVSAQQFFRVSRQYLVNFKAIKEIEHYFLRKLLVKLVIDTPEKLLINKERSRSFLDWMENR